MEDVMEMMVASKAGKSSIRSLSERRPFAWLDPAWPCLPCLACRLIGLARACVSFTLVAWQTLVQVLAEAAAYLLANSVSL